MKANGETAATICGALGIGRTTLYRYWRTAAKAAQAEGKRPMTDSAA
jgi:DNA invertase Pin-like site-specific DNA recombinase